MMPDDTTTKAPTEEELADLPNVGTSSEELKKDDALNVLEDAETIDDAEAGAKAAEAEAPPDESDQTDSGPTGRTGEPPAQRFKKGDLYRDKDGPMFYLITAELQGGLEYTFATAASAFTKIPWTKLVLSSIFKAWDELPDWQFSYNCGDQWPDR